MDLNKLFIGRVGRKKFLTASVILAIVNVIVMIPLGAMRSVYMYGGMYRFGGNERFADFHTFGSLPMFPMLLAGAVFLASVILYFSLAVRRLHDFGQSGWWSLFSLISPASLVLFIVLAVKKGDAGHNKYGNVLSAPVSWKKLYLGSD